MEAETTKQLVEVLDTTIKIGLGVLISGVTTYFVTRSNHKHEFSKEKFKQKVILLNKATGTLEEYFSSVHRLLNEYYGIASKNVLVINELSSGIFDRLFKEDQEYLNNTNKVHRSIPQLYILGLTEIIDLLSDYDEIIVKHRNKLMIEKTIFFSQNEIKELIEKLYPQRDLIYSKISKYFDELK